uniref:DNA polymerase I n=1 Tax=Escherichia phage vB_Eco_Lzu_P1 TaxID=3348404 RepID=A0AB74UKN7_9CAUD
MMIGGFSQEYIYLHMCVLDYEQNGIATVCDGDTKTIEEIEEIDDYTTEELCARMRDVPVWAKWSPLAAEGDNMYRYRR